MKPEINSPFATFGCIMWTILMVVIIDVAGASSSSGSSFSSGFSESYHHKPALVIGHTDWEKTPQGDVMVTTETFAKVRQRLPTPTAATDAADRAALEYYYLYSCGISEPFHKTTVVPGDDDWKLTPDGEMTATPTMMARLRDLGASVRAAFRDMESRLRTTDNSQVAVSWGAHDLGVFGYHLRAAVQAWEAAVGRTTWQALYPSLARNAGPVKSAQWMECLTQLGGAMRESCEDAATVNDLPTLGYHALSGVDQFNRVQRHRAQQWKEMSQWKMRKHQEQQQYE